MKNYAEEYFYMIPVGESCPLLEFVDPMIDSFLLYEESSLSENHMFKFQFGDPIPQRPKMGDAHNNAQHLVISDKLMQVMSTMGLKNVQYLPAVIEDYKNGVTYDDYKVLHIYNLINCMNKEKSNYKAGRDGKGVKWINDLVIDSEVLGKIPLAERLVFALGEKRLYMFFHASVVEKIVAINPEGLKFAPITKWNSRSLFEADYWEYILGE